MSEIVCVHGVGKQLAGEQMLHTQWAPAIADGLTRAGATAPHVTMAFYGDLFRPVGEVLAVGDPLFTSEDVESGWEHDMLLAWWREAAVVDSRVAPPDSDTLARVPGSVQTALRQLSRSKFFGGVALRALVFDLKQVSRYLLHPALRRAARDRVGRAITDDTRVVVAHSLGSIVAYETLAASSGHGVHTLVTIGSPLGISNLIFERLDPSGGLWPGTESWTNIADHGDIVALEKDLRPRFGPRVMNAIVHNGSHAHDATAYLTDKLTGTAIAGGLRAR
ncbi:hypothetical protein [Amycolatopsis sp. NPDC052450]|uniref:hypothetical protein n=1 Tax=Amycolatopsis sp. NPDC052450 TaxID=3363937 RepID=UPI0037CB7078